MGQPGADRTLIRQGAFGRAELFLCRAVEEVGQPRLADIAEAVLLIDVEIAGKDLPVMLHNKIDSAFGQERAFRCLQPQIGVEEGVEPADEEGRPPPAEIGAPEIKKRNEETAVRFRIDGESS